jgi:phosphate starvation-inducible PhoH-like protein
MAKQNVEKRVPKTDKKMALELNEEQREAKMVIYDKDVTVVTGKAGSGKTLVAVQAGLSMMYKRQVNKLVVIRPLVPAGEEVGFLKGDLLEKVDPYMAPIYANIKDLVGKEELEKMQRGNLLEVVPIAFARGRTFKDTFIIVDELQNMTDSQIKLIISRLGAGSKMVLTGDVAQVDLKDKSLTGISRLLDIARKGMSKYIGVYELQKNHRHAVVEDILNFYKDVA